MGRPKAPHFNTMADLITVTEYKDAEGLRGEKDDDRLSLIVPQVSDLVKKYCGTSFIDFFSTDKVETFSIEDNMTSTIIVSESPLTAVDKVEDFQPWSSIKKAKKDSWNKDSVKTKNTTYKIQPRFPVTKTFNFKRPVFIGNRAKYAAYALEGGKVQFFIQGELGRLIRETMKDKKGKLFVASRKMQDFGSSKGGVGYTEF